MVENQKEQATKNQLSCAAILLWLFILVFWFKPITSFILSHPWPFIIAALVFGFVAILRHEKKSSDPEYVAEKQRQHEYANSKYLELKTTKTLGELNNEIICPQCQSRGYVRTKSVKRKKGISGAKATGALFTGGLSILATGLSRKQAETQAHCEKCNSTWFF